MINEVQYWIALAHLRELRNINDSNRDVLCNNALLVFESLYRDEKLNDATSNDCKLCLQIASNLYYLRDGSFKPDNVLIKEIYRLALEI
jgi:hypothetical protein